MKLDVPRPAQTETVSVSMHFADDASDDPGALVAAAGRLRVILASDDPLVVELSARLEAEFASAGATKPTRGGR
jgi:hypothetical protein